MVHIKNRGIQIAPGTPEDYRAELMAIIKGGGEGYVSPEAFECIMDGVEVIPEPEPESEPDPEPEPEFEQGVVEEQPKPKSKKKKK